MQYSRCFYSAHREIWRKKVWIRSRWLPKFGRTIACALFKHSTLATMVFAMSVANLFLQGRASIAHGKVVAGPD